MKTLLIVAVALAGCTCGKSYLNDAADEVNAKAYDGKLVTTVEWKNEPGVAADCHMISRTIHVNGGWLWEPRMFLLGIIAHEMIHLDMGTNCPGPEDDADVAAAESPDTKTQHGYLFWVHRREVAEKLGIPTWAIPTGRKGTRLEAMASVRQMSREFNARMFPSTAIDPIPGGY
jgi:hypothetical protein